MREPHDFGKRSVSKTDLPELDMEQTFGCVGSEKDRSKRIMDAFFCDREDMGDSIKEAELQIKQNLRKGKK